MARKPEGMSYYEWEQVQAKEALSEILAMDRPGLRDNSYTILFLAEYARNKVTRLQEALQKETSMEKQTLTRTETMALMRTLQIGLDTPGCPPLSDSERKRAEEAAGKIAQLFMVAEGVEIVEAS